MKNISIDDRLKSIALLVDKCDSIADIGTDHGYLPIYLINNNIAKYAYACDVAIGPLNSAKENIAKYQLEDKITTILSDGLEKVPYVNTVIMAGMGGNLIAQLLNNKKLDYDTYILQANNNIDDLRRYLTNNNYEIIDEVVTYAHKKYYEIIKVVKGFQSLNDLQIKYGPINLIKNTSLFKEKWSNVLSKYESILNEFKGSESEKDRLLNEVKELKEILN